MASTLRYSALSVFLRVLQQILSKSPSGSERGAFSVLNSHNSSQVEEPV